MRISQYHIDNVLYVYGCQLAKNKNRASNISISKNRLIAWIEKKCNILMDQAVTKNSKDKILTAKKKDFKSSQISYNIIDHNNHKIHRTLSVENYTPMLKKRWKYLK